MTAYLVASLMVDANLLEMLAHLLDEGRVLALQASVLVLGISLPLGDNALQDSKVKSGEIHSFHLELSAVNMTECFSRMTCVWGKSLSEFL